MKRFSFSIVLQRCFTGSEEESDSDDQSIRLSALVQGSVSNHSSNSLQFQHPDSQYSVSEFLISPTSPEYGLSESVRSVMKSVLPTSNSLFLIRSEVEDPTNMVAKRTIRSISDRPRCVTSGSKKDDSKETNIFGPKKPKELIPLPTKGSGGSGIECFYKNKLQNYLLKQPRNPGARYIIESDSGGKFFCTVSFQSNFAISSRVLSSTEEEAQNQAALEANRWILGAYNVTDGDAAKRWLDTYATQVVGTKPIYTCSKIASSLYKSYIHLLSNKLFQYDEASLRPRVLLESSCVTSDPEVDVDESAIKTALQEVKLPMNTKSDNRKILNQYCLENGGTLPIIHTSANWHPKSGKMSWSSSIKSFITRSLSQDIERSRDTTKCFSSLDGYTILPVSTDFISVESTQIHKTPVSAEESAASNLLEKLGCPLKLVLDLQGSCKRELEQYVYEMDFSAAYHTIKIEVDNDSPMYECVVSSKCLYETKSNFSVTSDEEGLPSENRACESAAKKALRLLGLET